MQEVMFGYNTGDVRGTYVEGVSDEIIYLITMVAILLAALFTISYRHHRRHDRQVIHPDSADLIDQTRRSVRPATSDRHTSPSPPEQNTSPSTSESKPLPERTGVEPSAPPISHDDDDDGGGVSTDRTHPRYYDTDSSDCPICFNVAVNPVETNCGHLFCGECLLTYWHHGGVLFSISCPVCRRQVNILLPLAGRDDLSEEETLSRNSVLAQVSTYNRRFSGEPRPWYDYIRDAPILLRHLWENMFTVRGLDWIYQIRIIFLILFLFCYIVSPLDLIPEAIFGVIGIVDDIMAFFIFFIYLAILYRQVITRNGYEVE